MNAKILRYSLGFILLLIILGAFYYSKTALFIVSVIFIIFGLQEYRQMFKNKDIYIHPILPEIVGAASAYVFTFYNSVRFHNYITPILLSGIIFSFILTVLRNKKPYILTSLVTISAFLTVFCGLYIIKLTYYFEEKHSWYLIIIYFITILAGDFTASKVGPAVKKKIYIAPEISPNKTLAGSLANIFISCCICSLLKYFLNFSLIHTICLGIIISIFSQLGDLTVSSIKRDLGIKHSGNLFLNYGGILDRMDAFIFSAPAAYYFLTFIIYYGF